MFYISLFSWYPCDVCLINPFCKLENRFRGRVTRLGSSGTDIHTLPKAQLPFSAPGVSNSGGAGIPVDYRVWQHPWALPNSIQSWPWDNQVSPDISCNILIGKGRLKTPLRTTAFHPAICDSTSLADWPDLPSSCLLNCAPTSLQRLWESGSVNTGLKGWPCCLHPSGWGPWPVVPDRGCK